MHGRHSRSGTHLSDCVRVHVGSGFSVRGSHRSLTPRGFVLVMLLWCVALNGVGIWKLRKWNPSGEPIMQREGAEEAIRAASGELSEAEEVEKRAKAHAAAAQREPGTAVLGADTVVVVDDEVLGKPSDAADATRMLRLLSGRPHDVLTGVAVIGQGGTVSRVERTTVWFAPLSDRDIAWYVASGEPMDKAGAYAIQALASRFIPRIEGSRAGSLKPALSRSNHAGPATAATTAKRTARPAATGSTPRFHLATKKAITR